MTNYLTVKQMTKRSGVAASALRFYEEKGLIQAIRTNGNQRRYHPTMLRRIALIQVAQSVGFTLEEIGAELAHLPMSRSATQQDWDEVAGKWVADLNQRMSAMASLRDSLTGCIGCGCLSMKNCQLFNPDDTLAQKGTGAQLLNRD